jgi:hypothetical protein
MIDVGAKINETFKGHRQFDEDVRAVMDRALQLEEHKNKPEPEHQAHMAVALLAIEVAVSLANAFIGLRRPNEARYVRLFFDMVVGLNGNAFWGQHASAMMPLLHTALMDHCDSVSMQIERGETKISPWDKLIMGAEASVLAPFSQILFLVGGPPLQMAGSVQLKKELMPLLMK